LALLLALFILAVIDFFIALAAFMPKANAPQPRELVPIGVASLITYLTLVSFAMYPGRRTAAIDY
jgi:hypothetical protein